MRAVALKDFPYAPDGVQIVQIAEGQEFDCDPGSAPGMAEAGMIEILEGETVDGGKGNPEPGNGNPGGSGDNSKGGDGNPAPESVAAAEATEAAEAPQHPKAARKPRA